MENADKIKKNVGGKEKVCSLAVMLTEILKLTFVLDVNVHGQILHITH